MSLQSPAWPQRDEPSPCSTTTGLPPASSDSDSGCALEEYLEPSADPAPPEAPPCFGPRSPQPGSPSDRTRLRARALLQQLPPQDCDERYCPTLAEEERRQLRAFSARRRQEALGQGLACPVPGPCHGCPCRKCGRRLNKGDPGVSASRLGDQFWHPSCFSCHFCQQQLVDLIYFQQDGRIYCGRHHAELFRPRCASCDQLIFMEECIEAEGRRWHLEHFCCLECDEPLRGQRYVMRSGRPCCRGCFESLFAEPCQACGDPIGADSEEVTHQGLHWHARAACFCCSLCRKPLRGQPSPAAAAASSAPTPAAGARMPLPPPLPTPPTRLSPPLHPPTPRRSPEPARPAGPRQRGAAGSGGKGPRRFRIRPPCTPRSGARRISEQPQRSGAVMLPRSTWGRWDPQLATPRPPSPAQRGPTSLEPWATCFWGALTPEQPQAMQTHTSKRAHPLPDTAPGQRTARRRTTPGAPPAPHLRTQTRRRRASFSGSPSPSPG
ncbi:LOW QUALITY PROTEIN: prickle-like protein 4 [Corvus cornix cornix]|uniref:LOW QUALITY PROTEIN: prickle-like protein 4 n=1 Tax=Corvus cornix cornix TaxID=932674 RepID=UPI001950DD60|nr:LOW QUALITY PROTEIN: prickle-like protein 4 [Corvus cornix cornix]